MKKFLDSSFLLENSTAEKLYHSVSGDLPIIDYHNHLNPMYLAERKQFENITQLWISEDPYKHRAMRINGIHEKGITGSASDKEKFLNWAGTVPKTIGNPLFHWSGLELKRIFGIDDILSEKNGEEIWNSCNSQLQTDGFNALEILQKWKAEIVCTSDNLSDDLSFHSKATENAVGLEVLPSLRSDTIIANESQVFLRGIELLSEQCGISINTLDQYKEAIINRLDYFDSCGCRLTDHSLDAGFVFSLSSDKNADQIFKARRNNKMADENELSSLKSHLLVFLGKEYSKRGWLMQLHFGAQRYTSSRLRKVAGPAGGYAAIGKSADIDSLCCYLDVLEQNNHLPQTILYNLNPSDNAVFASLTGSFSEDGYMGKIQFGPAWWYNDHYDGIRQQLVTLSSYGLLSSFIGMTTDSRSLLSFSRHEYFRRILCNILGTWVEKGQLPNDFTLLEPLVRDISYYNSKNMIIKK